MWGCLWELTQLKLQNVYMENYQWSWFQWQFAISQNEIMHTIRLHLTHFLCEWTTNIRFIFENHRFYWSRRTFSMLIVWLGFISTESINSLYDIPRWRHQFKTLWPRFQCLKWVKMRLTHRASLRLWYLCLQNLNCWEYHRNRHANPYTSHSNHITDLSNR